MTPAEEIFERIAAAMERQADAQERQASALEAITGILDETTDPPDEEGAVSFNVNQIEYRNDPPGDGSPPP